MKAKTLFLAIITLSFTFCFGQDLSNLDFISPLHDGLSAIKKDSKWAFINEQGDLVIDFRDDLVTATDYGYTYPLFQNDRALVKTVIKGITFFGYIDRTGKMVIEPQYLNATPFFNGVALVHALTEAIPGHNDLLGKRIVYYRYYEALIDGNGIVVQNLMDDPKPITLDKEYLRKPPALTHRLIGQHLLATMNKDKSWNVQKIE